MCTLRKKKGLIGARWERSVKNMLSSSWAPLQIIRAGKGWSGPGTIEAGSPSSQAFGVRGRSYSNFSGFQCRILYKSFSRDNNTLPTYSPMSVPNRFLLWFLGSVSLCTVYYIYHIYHILYTCIYGHIHIHM